MNKVILCTIVLMFSSFTGCLDSLFGEDEDEDYYPDLKDRHKLDWDMSHSFSRILEPGPHYALEVQEATFTVDTSEVWESGPSEADVHLSYWLPSNTLEGEKVPVIAIISPYFSYGRPGDESGHTGIVSAGRGEFIYENFVPHGYALAQVAVFGTELSTGCFDYRGAGEGLGIHHAVEWLGSQEWSNGNVGLYGKSYEGATQWEAAAYGSEYLKTIVPISGTTALHALLYKNGSAEARSQIMHMNYFSSTVDYNADDFDNICPDILEGLLAGPTTYGAGEFDPYMENYYDERSHIDKAFENWKGSIYWIQGMQDWNVDPHQVFSSPDGTPWYQIYQEAGFEVKGMLGQWEHNYPDQWTKHNAQETGYGAEAIHNMTRWDWAQDLFEWFEYYLKGIGPRPDLNVQIQRNDGQWRIEETWPPKHSEKTTVSLGDCQSSGVFVSGFAVVGGAAQQSVTLDCPAFSETEYTYISGLVRLHLDTIAFFDGGQIFTEMQDSTTGMRLGHATMDIRYHEGGSEPQTVLPNDRQYMRMEFQGMDAIIPPGHGIRLIMTESGEDYLAPLCGNACPIHIIPSTSSLIVPHIEINEKDVFISPQSMDAANNI